VISTFIASSSLLGVQTFVALGASWLFSLNTAVVLLVLFLVNNPFTMVPIILANYAVGYIVFERLFAISFDSITPLWMLSLRDKISAKLPAGAIASFSIWNYLLGGMIFGLICSGIVYIILRYVMNRSDSTKNL